MGTHAGFSQLNLLIRNHKTPETIDIDIGFDLKVEYVCRDELALANEYRSSEESDCERECEESPNIRHDIWTMNACSAEIQNNFEEACRCSTLCTINSSRVLRYGWRACADQPSQFDCCAS